MSVPAIRAARVFLRHRGVTRRVCTVVVSGTDGSIYLSPNRAKNQYYFCGRDFFSPNRRRLSFNTWAQNQAQGVPKISIHATGQVHITVAGRIAAGPLWIPPLCQLEGVHIATILPDAMEALPAYSGEVEKKVTDSEHAWLVDAPSEIDNCRVVLHVGTRPAFHEDRWVRAVWVPLWAKPVFLAIGVLENGPLETRDRSGVTMLAGMDPEAGPDYLHFLWLTSTPPGWTPTDADPTANAPASSQVTKPQ